MEQKIICSQCRHFDYYDSESVKRFESNPEEFDCSLCHYGQPNRPKHVGYYHACGFCNNVNASDMCDCQESLEANTTTTKIVYDPKGVWIRPNRVNEKEEMGKANREFNKIVRNKKLEAEQRSIRMDKNLQRLVELMEAKALV